MIDRNDACWEKLCSLIVAIYGKDDSESYIKRIMPKMKRGNIELNLAILGKSKLEFEWVDAESNTAPFSMVAKEINRTHQYNVRIIASIRNEVYKNIVSKGMEINKTVSDFGVTISWEQKGGDIRKHPLLQMLEYSLPAFEIFQGIHAGEKEVLTVESVDKHAYLIIAHHHFEQLQTLIGLLDDSRNDIYVHVDKKSKDFRRDMIKTHNAGLYMIDRISVAWGGYSMVRCEMNLLKAAAPKHYRYYHLLSGDDLPLKTQDEIHDFFNANAGKCYIWCELMNENIEDRVRYFHLLRDYIGRTPKKRLLKLVERISLRLQREFGVHRVYYMPMYKGSQWFSISDCIVRYVLAQEKVIRKQFRFTHCADETFLHSVVMASPYRDSIINDDLRAIDWKRGIPYIYREDDVEKLLASDKLFARKFSCEVDKDVINRVREFIGGADTEVWACV